MAGPPCVYATKIRGPATPCQATATQRRWQATFSTATRGIVRWHQTDRPAGSGVRAFHRGRAESDRSQGLSGEIKAPRCAAKEAIDSSARWRSRRRPAAPQSWSAGPTAAYHRAEATKRSSTSPSPPWPLTTSASKCTRQSARVIPSLDQQATPLHLREAAEPREEQGQLACRQ